MNNVRTGATSSTIETSYTRIFEASRAMSSLQVIVSAPLGSILATSLGSPVLPSSLCSLRLERCAGRRRFRALVGVHELTSWHTVELFASRVKLVLLLAHNGLGLCDATSSGSRISLDADRLQGFVYRLLYGFTVES